MGLISKFSFSTLSEPLMGFVFIQLHLRLLVRRPLSCHLKYLLVQGFHAAGNSSIIVLSAFEFPRVAFQVPHILMNGLFFMACYISGAMG